MSDTDGGTMSKTDDTNEFNPSISTGETPHTAEEYMKLLKGDDLETICKAGPEGPAGGKCDCALCIWLRNPVE